MLMFAVAEGKVSSFVEGIALHVLAHYGIPLAPADASMNFRHLADMTGNYGRAEGPGQAWAYNDWGISLYFRLLYDEVFGQHPNDALVQRLGALQFEHGDLLDAEGGLWTTKRDFLRIGWFWLNRGSWNGAQLLPEVYFDTFLMSGVPASLPRTQAPDPAGDYLGVGAGGGGTDQTGLGPGIYGTNLWFNTGGQTWPDAPEDTIQANGHWNGEVLTIIPSRGLAAAWIGTSDDPESFNAPMNQILRPLVEALPEPPPEPVPMPAARATWRGPALLFLAAAGIGWLRTAPNGRRRQPPAA
jgi:hypothetical protein